MASVTHSVRNLLRSDDYLKATVNFSQRAADLLRVLWTSARSRSAKLSRLYRGCVQSRAAASAISSALRTDQVKMFSCTSTSSPAVGLAPAVCPVNAPHQESVYVKGCSDFLADSGRIVGRAALKCGHLAWRPLAPPQILPSS